MQRLSNRMRFENDYDNIRLYKNFITYLGEDNKKENIIKILYTDNCDPRIDSDFCNLTSDFEKTLAPFFNMISEIGEIEFKLLLDADVDNYSVIIADFCDQSWVNFESKNYLKNMLSLDYRILLLGDNWCKLKDDEFTSKHANDVINDFGLHFVTFDTPLVELLVIPPEKQTGLLDGVTIIYIWGVYPQIITHSFSPLIVSEYGILSAILE